MQRKEFLQHSSLFLAALAVTTPATFAQFLADPAWKIRMLTDRIGIFSEKGGTILFAQTDEGYVVVDSQFPEQSKHLIDELKKKGEQPFRLLINTHHHADHSSGNISFKDMVKHVLAHDNSKANQQRVAMEKKNEAQQLYPDQTYSTAWCEQIGGTEICLAYRGAGHTNGDSFVLFKKAKIVHVGDLVFNRRHPNIDKTSGANIANWIVALRKAVTEYPKKTRYVCGHAGVGYDVVVNKADVLAFADYLEKLLEYVSAAIKVGKTKEEILKTTSIPGAEEWKGDGIERPLTAAYIELTS